MAFQPSRFVTPGFNVIVNVIVVVVVVFFFQILKPLAATVITVIVPSSHWKEKIPFWMVLIAPESTPS